MNRVGLVCIVWLGFAPLLSAQDNHSNAFARVQTIFNTHCISCHGGEEPAAGMSLEAAHSYQNIVNVKSGEDEFLKRIRPNDVFGSYMFRKLLRDNAAFPFKEEGMPLERDPLSQEELDAVARWINSFPTEFWGLPVAEFAGKRSPGPPADRRDDFFSTQLINLPTTRTLGARTAEFRILHRFSLMNGGGNSTLRNFFGLDNGANTSINLSYAIRDNVDLLVRRTGLNKDIELGVKYLAFVQREGRPFSVGVYTGFDWISRRDEPSANRFSPNFQALFSSRLNSAFSFLVVPSLAFRSNHEAVIRRTNGTTYKDTRYTMGLGLGSEYRLMPHTAFVAEYIVRLDGYKGNSFSGDSRFNTWSVGMAHRIGLHVFEVLLSNNQGMHTTQYVPGTASIGSNKLFDQGPNFHFGFNIYRQFKW